MHSPSESVPRVLGEDEPAREAIVQAAAAPLREAFGVRIRLDVERVNRLGPWVFVQGTMRGSDGGRPNYAGTSYQAAAADGTLSDTYAALLKKDENAVADADVRSWRLLEYAIGPTDVAWLTWPDEHQAPRSVIGV
ncbi:hypothetical protein [Thermocrispum municipale]|jgi:hypothetical protein|uniref:hypothetical protein n=1 Tax=Thermocrispum municipale TaxID=37926 RepID=UPI00041E8250|nr:hypothetical protein [Thermocrispum municipale]